MRAYRGTMFLLAVLAALGAFVYFYEVRPEASDAKEQETHVFSLDEDDIVQVTWRQDEKKVVMVKDEAGDWQIAEPEAAEADEWTMMTLLWRLAQLTADRVVAESMEDPAAYKLAEPPMELTLGLADGAAETLYIGAENPRGTGFYAQKAGSPALYLINTSLVADLRKLSTEPPKAQPVPTPTTEPTPEAEVPAAPTPTP